MDLWPTTWLEFPFDTGDGGKSKEIEIIKKLINKYFLEALVATLND